MEVCQGNASDGRMDGWTSFPVLGRSGSIESSEKGAREWIPVEECKVSTRGSEEARSQLVDSPLAMDRSHHATGGATAELLGDSGIRKREAMHLACSDERSPSVTAGQEREVRVCRSSKPIPRTAAVVP